MDDCQHNYEGTYGDDCGCHLILDYPMSVLKSDWAVRWKKTPGNSDSKLGQIGKMAVYSYATLSSRSCILTI